MGKFLWGREVIDVLAAMNVSVHAARVSMDQLVDDCLPALLHAQASLRTVL